MTRKSQALKHIKHVDPLLFEATKRHHETLPAMLQPKRTRQELFKSLVKTVISQQLATKAADTIFKRLLTAVKGRLTPLSVLSLKPAAFRKAGLSAAKTKTIREIAKRIENKSLDLLALTKKTEAQVREILSSVWGLGSWSSDMFLMFALGRADMFSPGDLGLVRAVEALYALQKGTPREKIIAISEKWAPYRTYACLLLWRSRDTKAD